MSFLLRSDALEGRGSLDTSPPLIASQAADVYGHNDLRRSAPPGSGDPKPRCARGPGGGIKTHLFPPFFDTAGRAPHILPVLARTMRPVRAFSRPQWEFAIVECQFLLDLEDFPGIRATPANLLLSKGNLFRPNLTAGKANLRGDGVGGRGSAAQCHEKSEDGETQP